MGSLECPSYYSEMTVYVVCLLGPIAGRGGILEPLMTAGRKLGVPVGRGFAPPDWGMYNVARSACKN